MLTYEQVSKLLNKANVKGIMGSIAQRKFMFELAKGSTLAAEIGSYQGFSSMLVGLGMKTGSKYYCVDTYKSSNEVWKKKGIYGQDTLQIFLKHQADLELESIVIPVVGNSQDKKIIESVPNNLDFVYLDGSHETEDVYLDIINWTPKVKKDGLILFHDYTWGIIQIAVKRAIDKRIIKPYDAWDDFGICKKGGV